MSTAFGEILEGRGADPCVQAPGSFTGRGPMREGEPGTISARGSDDDHGSSDQPIRHRTEDHQHTDEMIGEYETGEK